MDDDRAALIEEHDPTACHLCPGCAARLEEVARMAAEVRRAVEAIQERGLGGLLTALR